MEYGCSVCRKGRPRKRKMKPYGAQLKKFWCHKCDKSLVSEINKKKLRREVKKQILKDIE